MATKTNSPKIDNTKISYGLEATRASIARNIAWATADIEEARQRLCEDFVGHFDREAERAYTSQLLLQHLTELSDDLLTIRRQSGQSWRRLRAWRECS